MELLRESILVSLGFESAYFLLNLTESLRISLVVIVVIGYELLSLYEMIRTKKL